MLGGHALVSGEEIVSAPKGEAKVVPRKDRDEFKDTAPDFFLFLRRCVYESLELGHFPVQIACFASCDLSAACDPQSSHFKECIPGIASISLHRGASPRHRVAHCPASVSTEKTRSSGFEFVHNALESARPESTTRLSTTISRATHGLHEKIDETKLLCARCWCDGWLRGEGACVTS